jgi:hypothetical protein
MPRKKIAPDQRVELSLTPRDRALVCDSIGTDDHLLAPLRLAEVRGATLVVRYTLDDLDELLGYVAAEANHAKDRRLAKDLYRICAHVRATMEAYDDGHWQNTF